MANFTYDDVLQFLRMKAKLYVMKGSLKITASLMMLSVRNERLEQLHHSKCSRT
jgi:hypothetical protein